MNPERARTPLRGWTHRHGQRLLAVGRRSQQVLLLAGATGAAVGLLVAGFEQLTAEVLLETVLGQPLWIHAAAPAMGLTVAAACVRAGGRNLSPATSDE